jgi:hypothetical protein
MKISIGSWFCYARGIIMYKAGADIDTHNNTPSSSGPKPIFDNIILLTSKQLALIFTFKYVNLLNHFK